MSYRISAFGAVALPDAMTEDDLSTARTISGLIDVVGGTFDVYGTRQRLPTKQELSVRGIYAGAVNFLVSHAGDQLVTASGSLLIAGSAANNLRVQVEELRAMVGRRDQLWRRRDDDGVLQWRYARLLAVQARGNVENWAADVAELTATFETAQGRWRSSSTTSAAATLPSGGAVRPLYINTGGNAPVEDAVITLAAMAAISSFRVQSAALGVDWQWTGSLSAGQSLSVDCGALTVRRDTTDVYANFGLNAGHTAPGWLPLAVGANTLTVTTNGAGTATATWYNQWL